MKKTYLMFIGILFIFNSFGQSDKDYYLRGLAKANKEKDYIGAIMEYNRAIKLNPNLKGVFFARAISKNELEDYRGAISDYNKDIEITPQNPGAYFNRGIVKYFKLKDKEGGCLDWSKSAEQGYLDAYDTIKEYCN